MSKQAKVRMADVLIDAGYGLKKVLRAIKYPVAESVKVDGIIALGIVPPESVNIDFIDSKKGTVESASIALDQTYNMKEKIYSSITRLSHDYSVIISIFYSRQVVREKYISTNNRQIPLVPTWPKPKALVTSE